MRGTRTVVFDATPLRGSSGHRGIGQFIFDLLQGLAETRDEWRDELRIRVVDDLDWRSGVSVCDDPGEAAERLFAARGTASKSLVHRRRLLLDRGAQRLGADLLHLPEALGTPLTRSVGRVVTCHDLIPLRMPREYLGRGLRRLTRSSVDTRRYTSAERLVAISERTRLDLQQLLGVSPSLVDVVPNGIDLSHWGPTPTDHDAARLAALGIGQKPYVVYVGYWDDRKDVPTMLRAVAEARKRTNLELVWAGRLTPRDLWKLGKYLERNEVSAHFADVKLTGFVSADDLAILYRNAMAHLFLSRLEGFGLSVVEAMASGCPVILANGSGADEVGGDAAIAVAQGDARAAADALVRLGADAEERRRRKEAGLARATKFGRVAMARGYLDVWRKVLWDPGFRPG
ncbi:MAG: glycosyltransferase family 4 protein [Deltaproteobacteria bacterium]|nr:glycosyltransferase family 4 protein [Deltaproteobacteria bacterium]